MSSHYGIAVIPAAHKNAFNVIYALWKNENPAVSENIGIPANATGDSADPITHWFGGRGYNDAELAVIQALPANIPNATWPVTGVSGSVTLANAQAAAAAMVLNVTTQETFTSQQAQQTLAAVMTALGIQRVYMDD